MKLYFSMNARPYWTMHLMSTTCHITKYTNIHTAIFPQLITTDNLTDMLIMKSIPKYIKTMTTQFYTKQHFYATALE